LRDKRDFVAGRIRASIAVDIVPLKSSLPVIHADPLSCLDCSSPSKAAVRGARLDKSL
jgi:hypothetical protein